MNMKSNRTTALAGLLLLSALPLTVTAQPLQPTILFSFTNPPVEIHDRLVEGSDGNFYGTTRAGGAAGVGTVFRFSTNGSWTTLFSFATKDGGNPSELTLANDGNFYGTTATGGTGGSGTIFRVTTNGGFAVVINFTNGNVLPPNQTGAGPQGGLTKGEDGNLYGTTVVGGAYGAGTFFRMTTNGLLTTLASFNGSHPTLRLVPGASGSFYGATISYITSTIFELKTNGTLTRLATVSGDCSFTVGPDQNLYGTISRGETNSLGAFFKLTPAGVYTTLAEFTGPNGKWPTSGLTWGTDGDFYGTTWYGGGKERGTIFRVTTNGTLTTLHDFTGTDGGSPYGGLLLASDGNFYGTTLGYGSHDEPYATAFRITPSGEFKTLVSFAADAGLYPEGGLTLGPAGNFYGTTLTGGANGRGTAFRVSTNGVLTTLVHFNKTNGGRPHGPLVLAGDRCFYGTTLDGGGNDLGTVFKMTSDGQLTTLVNFDGTNGRNPWAGLRLGQDGCLYGCTPRGGTNTGFDAGILFKVTTNGGFTVLHNFVGAQPWSSLAIGPDKAIYGGAIMDVFTGMLFKFSSGQLTLLASFGNGDGTVPESVTVLPDGRIFGTTDFTIFRFRGNGVFKTLETLSRDVGERSGPLTLGPDGNFYGITIDLTGSENWRIFKLPPNGGIVTLATLPSRYLGNPPDLSEFTFGPEGSLYGVTMTDLTGGGGAIFRLDLPPTIIAQPASRFNGVGTTASFTVAATGTAPFHFQWLKNGTNLVDGGRISGATGSTLSVTNVQSDDAADYSVIVTNIAGSAVSAVAALTVLTGRESAVASVQTGTAGASVDTITLSGVPNTEYLVQCTTNLTEGPWLTISTNTAGTDGAWLVIHPNEGQAQKYYRVVAR